MTQDSAPFWRVAGTIVLQTFTIPKDKLVQSKKSFVCLDLVVVYLYFDLKKIYI